MEICGTLFRAIAYPLQRNTTKPPQQKRIPNHSSPMLTKEVTDLTGFDGALQWFTEDKTRQIALTVIFAIPCRHISEILYT